MGSLDLVQEVVYIVVGLLLVIAAIAVTVGTVEELINSFGEVTDPVAVGLLVLSLIHI